MRISKDKVKGKIERRMWKKLREIAKIKANGRCESCGRTEGLQTDHCFASETCPELRFDHQNLSCICASCHTKKTYRIMGFEKQIDELVKRREGVKWWKRTVNRVRKCGFRWEIASLEQKEAEIDEVLAEIRQKGNVLGEL